MHAKAPDRLSRKATSHEHARNPHDTAYNFCPVIKLKGRLIILLSYNSAVQYALPPPLLCGWLTTRADSRVRSLLPSSTTNTPTVPIPRMEEGTESNTRCIVSFSFNAAISTIRSRSFFRPACRSTRVSSYIDGYTFSISHAVVERNFILSPIVFVNLATVAPLAEHPISLAIPSPASLPLYPPYMRLNSSRSIGSYTRSDNRYGSLLHAHIVTLVSAHLPPH